MNLNIWGREYPTNKKPVLFQVQYDTGVTFCARSADYDLNRFYGHIVAVFKCKPKKNDSTNHPRNT
jgi:hypothetical protein